MIDYGITQSTVKPEAIDVRETRVYTASDIKEIEIKRPETGEKHTEYEYNLKEYDKDEYISMMRSTQADMEQALQDLIMGA